MIPSPHMLQKVNKLAAFHAQLAKTNKTHTHTHKCVDAWYPKRQQPNNPFLFDVMQEHCCNSEIKKILEDYLLYLESTLKSNRVARLAGSWPACKAPVE